MYARSYNRTKPSMGFRMSKIAKLGQKVLTYFPLIILILIAIIWFNYYRIGFVSFNKNNAVSIFSSVIQGMSALLSIAIAVIVFRIQSLENRNSSLEQSTLDYIHRITRLTYPKWIPSVEDDIRSGTLAKRYYDNRVDGLNRTIGLSKTDYEKRLKELERDRDTQQKRLMETLNLNAKIEQTIQRMRNRVISNVILLIMPILLSFLFLMISDALDTSYNFVLVSMVVLMSAIGITQLITILLVSTVQSD